MAGTFITGLVIKHNNDVYLNPDTLQVGVIMPIPTPGAGGVIDGDFWAEPINDLGVIDGFNFVATKSTEAVHPTGNDQAFHVFRLVTRFGNDVYYVRGKTTANDTGASPDDIGYIEASQDAECCDATPRLLPTDVPVIAPCQVMCNWNTLQQYFGVVGLPALTGNQRYYPYGYFNNVPLTAGTATGYATRATLLTFLNSGAWGAIGTWTIEDDVLKVTQTAGPGTDILCAAVITVNPSA